MICAVLVILFLYKNKVNHDDEWRILKLESLPNDNNVRYSVY